MAYSKKTYPIGPATDGTDDESTQGSVGALVDDSTLDADHKIPARARDEDTAEGADVQVSALLDALDYYKAHRDWLMFRNALINGNFDVWQRGTTFDATTTPANSDDTYLADRWLLLSDGNDRADVTRDTDAPTGSRYAIKLDVETVGSPSEKFGICQIVEAQTAAKLAGRKVSLSFWAKTTGGVVENIRAHVLAWDGSADAVTSDLVSAWGAEGANPTFVANWTAENTAADLALSNSWQRFTIENIDLDTASLANVAVFIHVDDTDLVATDTLWISQVQLEVGPVAGEYQDVPFAQELQRCSRYYTKTFDYATAPAQATVNSLGAIYCYSASTGPQDADNLIGANWEFPIRMRAVPTITRYNPTQSNTDWRSVDNTGDVASATRQLGDRSVEIYISGALGSDEGFEIHAAADAEL